MAERTKNSSKRGNMRKERMSHDCLDDEAMKESFEAFRRWEQGKAAAMALEYSESQQQNSTPRIGSDPTTTNGLDMVAGQENALKEKLKKAKQKAQNAKDTAVFAEGLARVKKQQARQAIESNAQPKDKDAKRNVKEPQTSVNSHTPSKTNHSSKVRNSSTRESACLPHSHRSRKAQSFVGTFEEYEDDKNDGDYPNPLEDSDDECMTGYIAGLKEAEAAVAQLQTPEQPANTKFDGIMKEKQAKKAENYKSFSERTVEDNSSDASSLERARENHGGPSSQVRAWIQTRANEMQEEELNSMDLLGPDSFVQYIVSATVIRAMRHESKSQSGSLGRTVAPKFYI
ncbi:hypothetical protein DL95DRAFT_409559 [Leptodontidium sp. 2 PMI_412]|nr:hypothetical protein DL95DRAFT_409559 [Leptodontidium sp. 2 PMI_412]